MGDCPHACRVRFRHNMLFFFSLLFFLTNPLQPPTFTWGQFTVFSGGQLETASVPSLEKGHSPCLGPLSWERPPEDFKLRGKCKPGCWAPREEWKQGNRIVIKYGWECSCGQVAPFKTFFFYEISCIACSALYRMINQKSQILPTVWKRWEQLKWMCVGCFSTAMIPHSVVSVVGR